MQEWHEHHDKLRSCAITENQFVCDLSLCCGQLAHLNREEIQKFVQQFRTGTYVHSSICMRLGMVSETWNRQEATRTGHFNLEGLHEPCPCFILCGRREGRVKCSYNVQMNVECKLMWVNGLWSELNSICMYGVHVQQSKHGMWWAKCTTLKCNDIHIHKLPVSGYNGVWCIVFLQASILHSVFQYLNHSPYPSLPTQYTLRGH